MSKTITFNGVKVKYDDSQLNKWSVVKQLANPATSFDAMDKILCGRSDEVAEALGDSMESMNGLLEAISSTEGNTGKN